MNYLEKLKKYLQARINFELTGDVSLLAEIVRYADYFLEVNKPKNFSPYNSGNDLIRMDVEFEAMCSSLEENGVTDARNLTIFEFYSRCNYFEKKSKK